MDPLAAEYPFYTPYQFAGNKPIRFIDLDGLEEYDPMFDLNDPMLNPYFIADLIYTFGTDIADGAYNLLEDFKDNFLRSDKHRANNILMADPSLIGKYSNEELVEKFETNYSFKGYGKRKGYYVDTRDGYVAETVETASNFVGVASSYMGGSGPVLMSKVPGGLNSLFKTAGSAVADLGGGKILNMTSNGQKVEGVIDLGTDGMVAFDAGITINNSKLILSDIGFYQAKNDDFLGAANQGELGTLPVRIINSIKQYARSEGFSDLTLKFKRQLYDDAGKPTGYTDEKIVPVKL